MQSPDPCPADCWLAPTELYIVMAITVATFSLLLAPRRSGDPPLSGWIAWPSLAFLLWQVIQVAAYRDIEGWWPSLPVIMHQSTLLVYGIGLCLLLLGGWLNALRGVSPEVVGAGLALPACARPWLVMKTRTPVA